MLDRMSRAQNKNIALSKAVIEELRRTFFTDPIDRNMQICQPTITPQGTTYEDSNIRRFARRDKRDPFNPEIALYENYLFVNTLFMDIRTLLSKPVIDVNTLRRKLSCPLTKQLFQQPVVVLGYTYECSALASYLIQHQNHLPNKTPYTGELRPDLYPNLFVTSLLEHQAIQTLLIGGVPRTTLELQVEQQQQALAARQAKAETAKQESLTASLRNYKHLRESEDESWFGYTKGEKLSGVDHLIQAVNGTLSLHTFFSDAHKTDRDAMRQGRAKSYAAPALQYVEAKIRHQKS